MLSLVDRYSASIRIQNILIAIEMIKQHLLFGTGLGCFMAQKPSAWLSLKAKGRLIKNESMFGEHVHCDPVEVASDLGIIGFMLWAWLLISCAVNRPELLCLLVVMFVCSWFYFPMKRPHTGLMLWAILGLMSA